MTAPASAGLDAGLADADKAPRSSPRLTLAAGFVAALVAVGVVGAPVIVAAAGAAVLLLVLSAVDLAWVPAAALALFVLVPIGSLPVPSNNGAYNPALLAGAVLVVRCLLRSCPVPLRTATALTLVSAGVVAVLTVIAPARTTSAGWSVNYLVLVVAIAILLPGVPGAVSRVRRTWATLGAVLGGYALVEYLLGSNPLAPFLYSTGGGQNYAVYRVTTTLGNPVVNGLFFATAALVALDLALHRPAARWVLATSLSVVGVVGSGSRSAAGGAVLGAVLLIAWTALRDRETRRRAGAAGAGLVVAIAAALPVLATRIFSADAAGSDQVRAQTVQSGIDLVARKPWLGWGPGTADIVKRAQPVGDIQRGIENSLVQLLVSLGVVGTASVLLVLVATAWISLRRGGDPVWAAVLVAYCAVVYTNNIVEANRAALVLLGLTVGGGLAASVRRDEDDHG